jgi:hypothetical protein
VDLEARVLVLNRKRRDPEVSLTLTHVAGFTAEVILVFWEAGKSLMVYLAN